MVSHLLKRAQWRRTGIRAFESRSVGKVETFDLVKNIVLSLGAYSCSKTISTLANRKVEASKGRGRTA